MEHWLEIGSLLPNFVKHFIADFSISTKSWSESRIKHVNDKFWYFITILNLHGEVVQWLLLYCIVSLAFAIQRSFGQNVLAKVCSKSLKNTPKQHPLMVFLPFQLTLNRFLPAWAKRWWNINSFLKQYL